MRGPSLTTSALLLQELEDRDISVRALARLVAGTSEHAEVEKWRRNLNRYFKGADPKPEQAEAMEKALGKKEGYFPRYESRAREAVVLRLPPELAAQLREEVLETLAANDRVLEDHERRFDEHARRLERLERLLPREERGHG